MVNEIKMDSLANDVESLQALIEELLIRIEELKAENAKLRFSFYPSQNKVLDFNVYSFQI